MEKDQKIQQKEIDKAERIIQEYFKTKKKKIVRIKKEIEPYSLAEVKDKYISKIGTKERGKYKYQPLA